MYKPHRLDLCIDSGLGKSKVNTKKPIKAHPNQSHSSSMITPHFLNQQVPKGIIYQEVRTDGLNMPGSVLQIRSEFLSARLV
jgi:hypothetical protein